MKCIIGGAVKACLGLTSYGGIFVLLSLVVFLSMCFHCNKLLFINIVLYFFITCKVLVFIICVVAFDSKVVVEQGKE